MISTDGFVCKSDKLVEETRLRRLIHGHIIFVYNKDNISNWGKDELERSNRMSVANWPLGLVGADSIVSQSHKLTGKGQPGWCEGVLIASAKISCRCLDEWGREAHC